MTNKLALIENKLTSSEATNRLTLALGLEPTDEKARNEAFRYASSVLAEVARTQGDDKKDLTVCTPDSIYQSMIDAASFRIPIDGRQLAHLVKYGAKASFQPGYRAYIFKIKEHYPDADFTVTPLYEGDVVKISDQDGAQTYSIDYGSIFRDGEKDFNGVLVAVSYTDNGRLIKKVRVVPKERIQRARNAAKQDFVWKSDFIEKAKAAAIKAACKLMFTSIQGLQEIANYDNQNHFDVNKQEAAPVRKSIVDNINQSLSPPDTVQEAEIVDERDLEQEGEDASLEGVESLKSWFESLTIEEKRIVEGRKDGWKKTAAEVDAKKSGVDDI